MLQNDPSRLPSFHFDADLDPAVHVDADPNPTFHLDADPDLACWIRIHNTGIKGIFPLKLIFMAVNEWVPYFRF
jgi:hypothetical protein